MVVVHGVEDNGCVFHFDVRMVTIDFPGRESFVFKTVVSYFLSDGGQKTDHLHLFLGSSNKSHLADFTNVDRFFHIYPLNKQFEKEHVLHQRATYNYFRALNFTHDLPLHQFKYPSRDGQCLVPPGIVLLEDDILLSKNFFSSLVLTLLNIEDRERERAATPPFILSMYTPHWVRYNRPRIPNLGEYTAKHSLYFVNRQFCCTQAMFFPAHSLTQVTDVLYQSFQNYSQPYDLRLSAEQRQHKLRIYNTKLGVVQHVGNQKSTGLAGVSYHGNSHFNINNK